MNVTATSLEYIRLSIIASKMLRRVLSNSDSKSLNVYAY